MSREKPNILITGTPGCGKTTTAKLIVTLSQGLMRHIEVSKLVEEKGLHDGRDEERGCWIVDDDALCDELEETMCAGGIILDTHCCIDYFPERWFDLVVVLRCDNSVLYERLEGRGYTVAKTQENVQCEIMQVLLEEARENYQEEILVELTSDDAEQLDANAAQLHQWVSQHCTQNRAKSKGKRKRKEPQECQRSEQPQECQRSEQPDDAEVCVAKFKQWLDDNAVHISDGVRIDGHAGALRMLSTRNIASGEVLVSVPDAAILSIHNACNPTVDVLLDDGGMDETAILALIVAYERSIGELSHWGPYLNTLSVAEDLPLLWTIEELCMLQGTGVDVDAQQWRSQLEAQHTALIACIHANRKKCGPEATEICNISLLLFLQAATLISSRAFFVDSAHGDALCPVCDVFNHKCALIGSSESDDEGDEQEDIAVGPRAVKCATSELRAAARSLAAARKVNVDLECCFDAGERSDEDQDDEDDEEEDAGVGKNPNCVMMKATTNLRPYCEVFNTYAEYSNQKLLLDFGFVPENNMLDSACLLWDSIVQAAEHVFKANRKRFTKRLGALSQSGYWDHLLNRSFDFHVSGVPERGLLLLLSLLFIPYKKTKWTDETVSAYATQFFALTLQEQLSMRSSSEGETVRVRDLVVCAIQKQAAQLGEGCTGGPVSAQRLGVSQTFVEGSMNTWTACLVLCDSMESLPWHE